MTRLHEIVRDGEEKLCEAFTRAARPPEAGSRNALMTFLRELEVALALAAEGGAKATTRLPVDGIASEDDPAHAELAVDALAAARGFGALHDLVLVMARERGLDVGPEEERALASQVFGAIGRAALWQRRKQNQELHKIAHELRNPLGSAMMALTLLRSKSELGDNTRLADMMERNLHKLQVLIDRVVEEDDRAANVPHLPTVSSGPRDGIGQ